MTKTLNPTLTLTREILDETLRMPHTTIYVCTDREKNIVGCVTTSTYTTPSGRKAAIEDVAVLPTHRQAGLGRKMMLHVINQFKPLAPVTLCLTSKPCRTYAGKLYQSLGFQLKETNSYRLKLMP